MTHTEIKKKLYKQKPWAYFDYIREGVAHYYADLWVDIETSFQEDRVNFEIPISDMGNADFSFKMEAQLLNRWLV